jgi:undecaprenyl-diphosphatase
VSIDTQWLQVINDFARVTPWLHGLVVGYACYGVVLLAGLLLVAWWLARRRLNPAVMAAALWAPVGMLLAIGVNQPIVGAVHEARPYAVVPHLLVLASRTTDPSFPSDHSVMAGAVAAGVLLVSRRLGLLAVVAALLMAFSRVYIAAHYPHDVAAGLVLGAVVSLVGFRLMRGVLTRVVAMVQHSPLRPLVTPLPVGKTDSPVAA